MNTFRTAIGILLRLPVIACLTLIWTFSPWIIIASFTLLVLIGMPILYLILYPLVWLWFAFIGSKDQVLTNYWHDYPSCYAKWLTTGYPTLYRWLMHGWG